MTASTYRRPAITIRMGHETIAEFILRTSRKWRCDRLMAYVDDDGTIRCIDTGHRRKLELPRLDQIIGTFGIHSDIELVEDAVLEQKRSMRITPGRGKEVML